MTTRNDSPPRLHAAPARRARLELAALPSEVPRARHYLRNTLAGWGLGQASDDFELITCELLTNAISANVALPSTAGVGLLVTADTGRLTVTVRDASAAWPVRPDHDEDATAGRGLAIVEALSAAWGWAPDPPGKIVWAAVDL